MNCFTDLKVETETNSNESNHLRRLVTFSNVGRLNGPLIVNGFMTESTYVNEIFFFCFLSFTIKFLYAQPFVEMCGLEI